MTDDEFIAAVREQYGSRGVTQARLILAQIKEKSKIADENDTEFIREATIQTFWDAKKYNQRFRNKRKAG